MTGRLPILEVFRRVGEVLLALTDRQVQNNVRDTLVTLLKGLGHDDLPSTCTWMREIFATPGSTSEDERPALRRVRGTPSVNEIVT